MLVFEPRNFRRLWLTLLPNEELIASLRGFCERERVRSATFFATGHLEWIDLQWPDIANASTHRPQRYEGDLHLSHLHGTIAYRSGELTIEAGAVVAYMDEDRPRTLAGQVVRACSRSIDCVLESYEDLRLERLLDAQDGIARIRGDDRTPGVMAMPSKSLHQVILHRVGKHHALEVPVPTQRRESIDARANEAPAQVIAAQVIAAQVVAPSASVSSPPPGRFGAAQSASAAVKDESHEIVRGDYIEHKQFGGCKVERIDDAGCLIKMHNGTRKLINLSIFDIADPRVEGDRRIFSLQPKKR